MSNSKKQFATCQGMVVQDENCQWGGAGGGMVQFIFWNLTHFFNIQFKNTFNLIFLGLEWGVTPGGD